MIELRWFSKYHSLGPDMSRTTKVLQYRTLEKQTVSFETSFPEYNWSDWQDVPEVWDE